MKFITPLQLTPRPAQRSLTFIQDTPLQPAINLAQAARLSQDVDSQIPTSKTTPSPRDSPQQTPGYSPDGGSPPLTPQQKCRILKRARSLLNNNALAPHLQILLMRMSLRIFLKRP
jgi:hypothetical protein